MNEKIKPVIPALLLAIFFFLGYQVYTEIRFKNEIADSIKQIPDFSFITTEDEIFSKANLKKNTPVVLLYFHSECYYCQREAEEIYENKASLKGIQVIFISNEPPAVIQKFAAKYKMDNYNNIHFLYDAYDHFVKIFEAPSIPFILIYNKHQELIEKRKGQIKVSAILEALQKDERYEN